MDRQALALLIPIVAMLIPIAAIVMHGWQKVAMVRLEEARARALGAGSADVTALRDEVAELRREVGDMQERIDFTERMLAQQREAPRLPER